MKNRIISRLLRWLGYPTATPQGQYSLVLFRSAGYPNLAMRKNIAGDQVCNALKGEIPDAVAISYVDAGNVGFVYNIRVQR